MDLWDWYSLIWAIAGSIMLLMAAGLAVAGSPSRFRSMLLWVLVIEGVWGASGFLDLWVDATNATEASLYLAYNEALIVTALALPVLYLMLVGEGVRTRWTSWSRARAGRIVLWAGFFMGVLAGAVLSVTDQWDAVAWGTDFLILAVNTYALIVSIMYVSSTTAGTPERRRAIHYAVAFACHDLIWIGFITANLFLAGLPEAARIIIGRIIPALFGVAFALTFGYATLSGSIIDFDRHLHRGIKRGTIVAIFIGVFVGVQTLVSETLTSTIGLAAGALSAALLAAAWAPLQSLSERFADAAAPAGRGGTQLSAQQRESFYTEQVEIAYSDGKLGAKERQLLRSVRERLGVSDARALAIEDTVVLALGAA